MPVAELTSPPAEPGSPARAGAFGDRLTAGSLYLWLIAAALALGALSLLIPSTPSYDPWAWLVWGREIVHLNLQTTGGPSWKPLPMIFTTLFAPFGKAAPDLWLIVARAGALMSVAMVFKVAVRLVGQLAVPLRAAGERMGAQTSVLGPALLAGTVAALGLINARGFISDNALGYSEGLMTALVLIAVDRHLDGRPRQSFAVGFFAALDRPEIWLFWGPYGLWLAWKDPGARKLVAALFLLIPVLWFAPEYWGSGHFFRGVSRAQQPRSNSAAFAHCPLCTEFIHHAWPTVLLRAKVVAVAAILVAATLLARGRRAAGRWRFAEPRFLAQLHLVAAGVLGFGWWVLIAVMTQAGFSGNDRYLVLGGALVQIAAGTGYGWLALELGRVLGRWVRASGAWLATALVALAVVLVPNWIGRNVIDLQATHRALAYQARLRTSAAAAVQRLGGGHRVYACGTVMTEGFQVPMLAWDLGVHTLQVQAAPVGPGTPPPAPNVIFQTRAQRNASLLPTRRTWPTTPYRLALRNRTFRVYEHCAI